MIYVIHLPGLYLLRSVVCGCVFFLVDLVQIPISAFLTGFELATLYGCLAESGPFLCLSLWVFPLASYAYGIESAGPVNSSWTGVFG